MVSALNPICTIDLTSENDSQSCKSVRVVTSKNKLKKYIKINKYIVKTQKMVKRQKFFIKNVKLNRERLNLLKQLDMYSFSLEQSTRRYKIDTENMQSKLDHLQDKLNSMTSKYNTSEHLMREYVLAMNDLVDSQTNNCEHCQLTSNVQTPDHLLTACDTTLTQTCVDLHTPVIGSNIESEPTYNDIIMFSDEIGRDLGHLISAEYPGQKIINNCMPGCSLYHIMKEIIKCNFNPDTSLLIFIGNRGNLNKGELLQYHRTLCNLNLRKIVLFTFPYSRSLPQEENFSRFNINMTLHNLTYNNNVFQLIDINNYIDDYFYLTKDRYHVEKYYLTNYCKRQIAMSLAYLFSITAKNIAKQVDPIEQCRYSPSLNNLITVTESDNHLN